MLTDTDNPWAVRLLTLAVWAAAGASAVYWGLRVTAPATATSAPVVANTPTAPDVQAVARALGAQPGGPAAGPAVQVPASTRLALIGVLAGLNSGGGAALIAADGQPPQPFRVGAVVHEGLVLQNVQARTARLGHSIDGPAVMTLEMPALVD